MIRLRHKLFIHALRLTDQLILALSLLITVSIAKGVYSLPQFYIVFQREYRLVEAVGLIGLIAAWSFIFNRFMHYDTGSFISFGAQTYKLAKACTTAAFALLLAGVVFEFETLTVASIALFWVFSLGLSCIFRFFGRLSLILTKHHKENLRHILIIGTGERTISFAKKLEANPELGCMIIGFVLDKEDNIPDNFDRSQVIGNTDDLANILQVHTIDEIIIGSIFQQDIDSVFKLIEMGHDLGIVVRLIPKPKYASILKNFRIESYEGEQLVTLFREQLVFQLFAKRLIDIGISVTALTLLLPLLIVVSIAIKLTSEGPLFFAQERVGMNKRRFILYKFRSMVVDAEMLKEDLKDKNEADGPVFKIEKDPRVTKIGRIIRKTSIDELPQLWNVLKGDMSLVGPRPPLPTEVDQYEWLFRKRLSIKPGITCLWQVSGRSKLSFEEWMKLDKQYVENWSIWFDLKILLKTIPTVIFCKGAS